MRVARRAGSQQATSATTISTSGAATKVRRSAADQEARQDATRRQGGEQAGDGAQGDERGALSDDERDDVAALGPQRHADPDLSAPLRHRVAEQPVDAERGEEQRERCEAPDEAGVKARLRERGPQPCVHGDHVSGRRARVRLRHRLS